jgi:hypothetical protein
MTNNIDTLLNEAIYDSFRNNILNMYHGEERMIRNPNRIPLSLLRTTLSSRYYNSPQLGGYQINEEHDYNLDIDDLTSLIFLDVTSRFSSPVTESELRKDKIKQIKYRKVKEPLENECPICLECISVGEYQKVLNCKHSFHKKCIDRWFKKDNDFCPMCRLKVIN